MKITVESINEIDNLIKPDTFVTLSVRQGITSSGGAFIAGSPEAYERAVCNTYNAVITRLYGKRARRRRDRCFLNLTTVERSGAGRWHIHACIKRPSGVSIELFRQILLDCWLRSDWAETHNEVAEYRGGGIRYILKDGQDSILTKPSRFFDV